MLDKSQDVKVVGEARDGYEAVDLTTRLFPDIVLMDADMPKLDGFQAAKNIQSSGLPTRVIMLSAFSNDTMQQRAQASGAQAYLLKESSREELLGAGHAVYGSQQVQAGSE